MANWQATNVLTGAVEGPKYVEVGTVDEIWSVALTTALALNDVILGPVIPAGTYLDDVKLDCDDLDGATSITMSVGYASHTAAFITASTIARAGGIQGANVAGTIGFTSTTNTQVLVTITAAAGTPVAGTLRILVRYTAS